MRRFRNLWISLIVLGMSAIAIGATVYAPAADTAVDYLAIDAEGYTAKWGVSVSEAKRRFELIDLAGKLNHKLRDEESETFAGFWVEHTPEFGIVVQFTSDGEKTIAPYIQGTVFEDITEVRTAKVSRVDLKRAQAQAGTALDREGIPYSSDLDTKGNHVKLYVAERSRLEDALQAGRVQLPGIVEVIEVDPISWTGFRPD